MASERTCTKCGETKPLDGFSLNNRAKDGRGTRCKGCVREYQRRYHEENRNKELERQRRYRDKNREKMIDRHRRWREENREKEADYRRRYREENRDIINQKTKSIHAQYKRASNLLASKKGAPYSPQDDALILADNGMTDYQKAIELGRTYASVAIRKHHLRARANH